MTETQWQNAAEPHAMLEFLRTSARVSERKLRLFAVACSRRSWALIDALGRNAVEVAEKFADGLVGSEQMRTARLTCQTAGGQAAWYPACTNPAIAARNAARSAQAGVIQNPLLGTESAELLAQAHLLRDIFGPTPFRHISIDSAWQKRCIVQLAQEIYHAPTNSRMADLADVLCENSCDNDEILRHCREPGPHVRGCWVLDLLLGASD